MARPGASSGYRATLKNEGCMLPVLGVRSDQPGVASQHIWKNDSHVYKLEKLSQGEVKMEFTHLPALSSISSLCLS